MKTGTTKSASKMRTSAVLAAILCCFIVLGAGSASAASSVLRNTNYFYVDGECCVSFDNETVSITEPATIKPVVVLWSAGYSIEIADNYLAGLSVNGGACAAAGGKAVYGPAVIPDFELGYAGNFSHVDFQWIILPSDGVLKKGTNTFALCGGGANSTSDQIVINSNTLSVQLR